MQESRNLTRRNHWKMEEDGEGTKEHFGVNGGIREEKNQTGWGKKK